MSYIIDKVSSNSGFNVIIPMAGESSRFNYSFKPLLYLDNRSFLEHVLDGFKEVDVQTYNFIVTQEQETNLSVEKGIYDVLPKHIHDKINVIKIKEKTIGPYQTILKALELMGDMERTIICDCDHSIDISPMIKKIVNNPNLEVIVPTWGITKKDQKNWGKVVLNDSDKSMVMFCEKEELQEKLGQTIYGTIGCYYFKSTSLLNRAVHTAHFSDFFIQNYSNIKLDFVLIKNAYFFGTPLMAKNAISQRRRWGTIFCDIDGVLVEHKNHSNDLINHNKVLNKSTQKLKDWKKQNNKIILSTARPERTRKTLVVLLKQLGITYDDLIMGLNPGPRYLINDLKPSNQFVNQAISVNLKRNEGLAAVSIEECEKYDIEIIKTFRGNSFSKVLLLRNKNNMFVRKHILKNKDDLMHYEKLKRQLEDIKRFSFYDKNLVPEVLGVKDEDHQYYFDLQYLENYKQLDEFADVVSQPILNRVVEKLANDVYSYKKANDGPAFILDFFSTKINPKLDSFERQSSLMNHLINSKVVKINNKEYLGLREILEEIDIFNFNTEFTNPIHGDLTLENILYNESFDDFKLIDMDGSRYMDSCYFDLGKIFQSIVSKYAVWNKIENVIIDNDVDNIKCIEGFFNCDPEKFKVICIKYAEVMEVDDWQLVFEKGIFYMAMYFIRFVPFRKQISDDHAVYALIMAINWLNFLKKD